MRCTIGAVALPGGFRHFLQSLQIVLNKYNDPLISYYNNIIVKKNIHYYNEFRNVDWPLIGPAPRDRTARGNVVECLTGNCIFIAIGAQNSRAIGNAQIIAVRSMSLVYNTSHTMIRFDM